MSLVTRLSAFFLGALAFVLIGFSLSLYVLARSYVFNQAEERLVAALETLSAAVDVETGGLEWEGNRRVTLGRDNSAEQPRWEVRDAAGLFVDRSANLNGADFYSGPSLSPAEDDAPPRVFPFDFQGQPWLLAQRRRDWKGDVQDLQLTPGPGQPPLYSGLVITAGISLAPAYGTLQALAVTLAGLSLVLWLSAAVVGRYLCRRALAPVAQMAEAARDMGAADLSQRLPSPGTHDELGELHRAFNGLLDRLEEAFERQRRFTGDASHQLRTPLTAMLGQLELALRRDRTADEYRRILAEAHGQAGRLRQIVEALLFLARADAEAGVGELEEVDLAAWLPVHLASWSVHPRAADLRMESERGGPVLVRAQPLLLGQLLDNLLENAFKYSAPGAPVTVQLSRHANAAILAVHDSGDGIAPDELPHVFDPFYRSAEARRRGLAGTGLGLAIARRIATAFGGTLTVESQPGKGSRFSLNAPGGAKCGQGLLPGGV
jgi:heavy metal sensor kinase